MAGRDGRLDDKTAVAVAGRGLEVDGKLGDDVDGGIREEAAESTNWINDPSRAETTAFTSSLGAGVTGVVVALFDEVAKLFEDTVYPLELASGSAWRKSAFLAIAGMSRHSVTVPNDTASY